MQRTKIVEERIVQKVIVDAEVYRLQAGGDCKVVGPTGAFCWRAIIAARGGSAVVGVWDGGRGESGGGGGLGGIAGKVEAVLNVLNDIPENGFSG